MNRTYLKTVWAMLPSGYSIRALWPRLGRVCMIQLLCVNHNLSLLTYLRTRDNRTSHVLVVKSLIFLGCIYGSAAIGLGLLRLYPNVHGVSLIVQPLESRVEYCTVGVHVMTEYLSPLLLMSNA